MAPWSVLTAAVGGIHPQRAATLHAMMKALDALPTRAPVQAVARPLVLWRVVRPPLAADIQRESWASREALLRLLLQLGGRDGSQVNVADVDGLGLRDRHELRDAGFVCESVGPFRLGRCRRRRFVVVGGWVRRGVLRAPLRGGGAGVGRRQVLWHLHLLEGLFLHAIAVVSNPSPLVEGLVVALFRFVPLTSVSLPVVTPIVVVVVVRGMAVLPAVPVGVEMSMRWVKSVPVTPSIPASAGVPEAMAVAALGFRELRELFVNGVKIVVLSVGSGAGIMFGLFLQHAVDGVDLGDHRLTALLDLVRVTAGVEELGGL